MRLDDDGEYYELEKPCKQENLRIKFEFSGPLTPKRNGKVERKFQNLYGRIREMMNDSGIEGEFCEGLWAECASTASFYEDIIVNKGKKKPPIELMLMFNQKVKELRNFKRSGEMCVATTIDKIQSKISDKGTTCIFVGYAVNHADDVYRLLNPETKKIIKIERCCLARKW